MSFGDEDEISQKKNSLLSNEDENPEKLNLKNNKSSESERSLIDKEEKASNLVKEEERPQEEEKKEEIEQHPLEIKEEEKKEQEDKKEEQKKENESRKTKKKKSTKKQNKPAEVVPKEGEKEDEKKKEGENEDKKEDEKDEKKDEKKDENDEKKETPKEELDKKIKIQIVPYKVSPSYPEKLLKALKESNRLRPKVLLAPEKDDITRNIKVLDEEEKKQREEEKKEDLNAETKEREEKMYLNHYKESNLLGETKIQDPMALFYGAEKVYIDQFYKLSDLFVICPLYFNYRISLEYKISDNEYAAYHLFNTKEISPACSHNFCANQAREIDINIINFVLESQDRKIQKFLKLRKNCRCAFSCLCACCSRPTFVVETPVDPIGKIVEVRTTTDPLIHVFDGIDELIYVITAKCSDCGYFCRDECCGNRKCAEIIFTICDSTQEHKLGFITKNHRSGKRVKPDYDQLSVTFPPGISCQNKVLLMCSALVLEYLYFQNLSNTKRCSGRPRFLNAYSD